MNLPRFFSLEIYGNKSERIKIKMDSRKRIHFYIL